MAHYFHYIKPDAAPVKDLARLLNHLWADELNDYAASTSPQHLFHHLVAIANWLNAGTTWTARDYVAAWESSPDDGWLVARGAADAARLSESPGVAAERAKEPPCFEVEESGARYLLRLNGGRVTVVVGWHRQLNTYFAQVWDVPEWAGHYEDGNVLLWVGTEWNEVLSTGELVTLLAPYIALPPDVRAQLIADRTPELKVPCEA